ncbi:MAG: MlaD family protein [Pseudomonadota bacterium]
MRESIVETLIGVAVVAVAAAFLWFALARGGDVSTGSADLEVGARFSSVSGVDRGADVRIAGVKVGVVQSIRLDWETNEALLTMGVDSGIEVFDDAVARIQTDGLLGGSYIALDPGYDAFELGPIPACGAGESLFDGTGCSMIANTQGSVDLLTLFASFASGGDGGSSETSAEDDFGGYPE